jgi:hypothetical protein
MGMLLFALLSPTMRINGEYESNVTFYKPDVTLDFIKKIVSLLEGK